MRRRLGFAVAAASAGAIAIAAAAACLPEYRFGAVTDGGPPDSEGGPGRPSGIDASGAVRFEPTATKKFDFKLDVDATGVQPATTLTGTLKNAFYIDAYEVTVGRFQSWIKSGHAPPCAAGRCALDPGGPYADTMLWDASWNQYLQMDTDFAGCGDGPLGYGSKGTFALGDDALPMTCVSWFEAAAFCFSENKRLPTELEWQFVATARGTADTFPWEGAEEVPLDCDHVVFNFLDARVDGGGCHFPKRVGSAPRGATDGGIFDLSGSVFEWVWDVGATFPNPTPDDYSGPPADAATSDKRVRRGGSFNSNKDDNALRNWGRAADFSAGEPFKDLGFRCARSAPP